uniref:Transmembrane 4 L6 family member 4-like n=1 Tax=Salarias fasciatus TaxID=181472 RepID=A0A672IVZ1_SALFA
MCSGSFAKCLGISLMPLAIACMLCNILLFFPGGETADSAQITVEVLYCGGLLGSGVLMIFPALVFFGLKNNDCCGCCGNESCGRRFAMLSSILFAAVGVFGAGYSVIISAVNCEMFEDTVGTSTCAYTTCAYSTFIDCISPRDVVPWHLTLFSMLLIFGLIQMALCVVQVLNGLFGALCGDCCGCCSDEGLIYSGNDRAT